MKKTWPLSFFAYGIPQPQGSTRAFMRPGMRYPVITSDNKKNKPWRQEVAGTAEVAMSRAGLTMLERSVPVRLEAAFIFQKPKSARKATVHKTTKPDIDKLARSLMDSLTGIVFEDDSQVTQCDVNKHFGSPARVQVTIRPLGDSDV